LLALLKVELQLMLSAAPQMSLTGRVTAEQEEDDDVAAGRTHRQRILKLG
jgi:hypothetical protein